VLGGFSELILCVGWLPQALVGLWGLGAVIMTRFGTQEYIPARGGGDTSVDTDAVLPDVEVPQMEVSDEAETVVAPVVEVDPEPDTSAEEPLLEDTTGSDEPADPELDD